MTPKRFPQQARTQPVVLRVAKPARHAHRTTLRTTSFVAPWLIDGAFALLTEYSHLMVAPQRDHL